MSGSSEGRRYGVGSLVVQKHSDGRIAWFGKFYIGKRQFKRRLGLKRQRGSREGLTRIQAEQKLFELREELGSRSFEDKPVVELKTAADRYINHVKGVLGRKGSTTKGYEYMRDTHFSAYFSQRKLESIEREDIEGYMRLKAQDGLTAKTVRNHLSLLHSIFEFGTKRGWVDKNPVKLVDKPESDGGDPDIRWLDDAELEAVIRAVNGKRWKELDKLMYRVAAMTGLRRGELIALKWRFVDWAASSILVRWNYTREDKFHKPKSKRGIRRVPMADKVAGELHRYFIQSKFQGDDDLVFCHPELGTVLEPDKVSMRFTKARKKAKIKEATLHDLRHTFGTRMAAAGVPLRTLQEWMGHKQITTTEIYADYQPSTDEAAIVESAFEIDETSTNYSRTKLSKSEGSRES